MSTVCDTPVSVEPSFNPSSYLTSIAMFNRGQLLKPTDLFIRFSNAPCSGGQDPYQITYAIFHVQPNGTELLISPSPVEVPVRQYSGYYYASGQIPGNLLDGNYRIRWSVLEAVGQTVPTLVLEDFIIGPLPVTQGNVGDERIRALAKSLRTLLRDNDPDRNYHFRPPSSAGFLHRQTKRFGFIWTDDELMEYSIMAVDLLNSSPPATGFTIQNFPDRARTLILYGAAYHALIAITLNWIEEEFDYSIGGISLSIEKSSKYESMKQNLEQLWADGVERFKASIKIHKGLQQPRYNPGARSLFGPYTGRNVLSIRQLVAPQRLAKP